MHEMAICETILKIIEREARVRGIHRVRTAKLKIGRMAGFERANLDLCLKGLRDNEILSSASFKIEEVPVKLECKSCHHRFLDPRFDDHAFSHKVAHAPALYTPPPCPTCNNTTSQFISGQEMELVSIRGM